MNKEDVLQFLKDGLYIVHDADSSILTSKFFRDFGVRATPTKNGDSIKPARTTTSTITKEDYKQFIKDAEVPTMISNGNGSKFFANRFSETGFKAFKALPSEIDKKVLLAACKWYYKQTQTARVMIGNWFSEGIWESCYDDVKKAMENRDKKVTVLGTGLDNGYPPQGIFPKIVNENDSNMEQG
jgi:hypothetical protein